MTINRDKYLNSWVVWEKQGSIYYELYESKRKKDCERYIEKHKKKRGNHKK